MIPVLFTVCAVLAAYLGVLVLMLQLEQVPSLAAGYTSLLFGSLIGVLVFGAVGALIFGALLVGRFRRGLVNVERPEDALRTLQTFTVLSLLFPVFVLIVLSMGLGPPGKAAARNHYGAIIDAGSSGSRIAIFEWRIAGNGDPHVWPVVSTADDDLDIQQRDPQASKEGRKSKGCPLTSLSTEKERVCTCLRALTNDAHTRARHFLAESTLPPIALWVKATAGVRYENETTRDAVLKATTQCLGDPTSYGAANRFAWRGAQVISGEEEGLYAWLAVNHVARTLRSDLGSTFGIVEIGGKSAQLAFRVADAGLLTGARGKTLSVPLASGTLHVHALSQELGQTAARKGIGEAVVDRDCALGGNTKSCVDGIKRFLCRAAPTGACANLKPDLAPPGTMRFAGLSNFAYATRNLGLANLTLDRVGHRANEVCSASYGRSLRDRYLGPGGKKLDGAPLTRLGSALGEEFVRPADKYWRDACFSALYVTEVADSAWGVPLKNVSPPDPQWASDPSWPLGAMLIEALKSPGA